MSEMLPSFYRFAYSVWVARVATEEIAVLQPLRHFGPDCLHHKWSDVVTGVSENFPQPVG